MNAVPLQIDVLMDDMQEMQDMQNEVANVLLSIGRIVPISTW